MSLLADENFNRAIVDGLRRRDPLIDVVRVQDVGLRTKPDDEVLAWAAAADRIVLTHDYRTMPPAAYARVGRGDPMPGVFMIPDDMGIGQAVDEVLLAVGASFPGEFRNSVRYFPL